MRRTMRAAALAVILAGWASGLPSNHAIADTRQAEPSEWRDRECRYQGLDPETWAQREVVLTIECAVAKWPVPGGASKAVSVASCESALHYNAINGSYKGIYQQAIRYWPGRQNAYGPNHWDRPIGEGVFNARSNIVVSIHMASDGWAPDWTGCA